MIEGIVAPHGRAGSTAGPKPSRPWVAEAAPSLRPESLRTKAPLSAQMRLRVVCSKALT